MVTHSQYAEQDELIDGKQCNLENGHNQQLEGAGFTQNCSEGDQHRAGAEVSIDHTANTKDID